MSLPDGWDATDVSINIKVVEVTPDTIEETINKLLENKDKSELNKSIPEETFWVTPIDEQVKYLAKEWSNPNSDCKGKIFYTWREYKQTGE